jgi:SAM-dependent methyltransferase
VGKAVFGARAERSPRPPRRLRLVAALNHGRRRPIDRDVPLLSENKSMWDDLYAWPQQGDEWSAHWGGVSHQWWVTLFPRLQGYVPAGRILEIAPGYGRWTHFLKDLCGDLVAVDIAGGAIEHCRARFAADRHVSFHVNDGLTLPMVADGSIDLVFSFDSLVHAELDVMGAYLTEIAAKLTADGVAFLHHSNMGAYTPGSYDPAGIHWRAVTVSAQAVEALAVRAGLSCVSQETLAWGNEVLLNDCISVITRAGSRWDRDNVRIDNPEFSSREITASARLAAQYPPSSREVIFGAVRR